jgi:maltooligosyltrehalose synthase
VNWESKAEIRGYKKFFSIADRASMRIESDPESLYIREIHEILDLADPLETMG